MTIEPDRHALGTEESGGPAAAASEHSALRLAALLRISLGIQAEHPFLSDRRYYPIHPEHKRMSPALAAFATWLDEEAARYRAEVSLT